MTRWSTDHEENQAYRFSNKHQTKPPVVQTVKVKESDIVNACIRWCWAHGIKARRQNTGAFKTDTGQFIRFGKKGSGDIIFCLKPHGRYGEIECKRPGGKQQPEQIAHQQEIEADGGLYIIAFSTDDLERELKPLL